MSLLRSHVQSRCQVAAAHKSMAHLWQQRVNQEEKRQAPTPRSLREKQAGKQKHQAHRPTTHHPLIERERNHRPDVHGSDAVAVCCGLRSDGGRTGSMCASVLNTIVPVVSCACVRELGGDTLTSKSTPFFFIVLFLFLFLFFFPLPLPLLPPFATVAGETNEETSHLQS